MSRGFMRRGRKKNPEVRQRSHKQRSWLIISTKISKKVISLPNAHGKNTENKNSTSQLHPTRATRSSRTAKQGERSCLKEIKQTEQEEAEEAEYSSEK